MASTERVVFATEMQHRRWVQAPGLGARTSFYFAAATLVCLAAVSQPSLPREGGLILLVALGVAHAFAIALPMTVRLPNGSTTGYELANPALAAMALLLPAPTMILVVAVTSFAAGWWIRAHRTTPGRLPLGMSRTIVGAGIIAAVVEFVSPTNVSGAVMAVWLALVAHGWVWQVGLVVIWHLGFGRPLPGRPSGARFLRTQLSRSTDVSLAVLAWILAGIDVRLLALLAAPLASALIAGTYQGWASRQRAHSDALRELATRLNRATSVAEVLELACETAADILGAAVEVSASPAGRGGVAAPIPWAGMETWLVAPRRFGPPRCLGRYQRDERAFLDSVAELTASPAEAVRLVDALQIAALTDELTGLPNRRATAEHLERTVAAAAREGRPLAIAFADVDRFKDHNTRLGHDGADALLRIVAEGLAGAVRAGDLVGRWGGEEFIAVLADCDDIAAAGERLRAAVAGSSDGVPITLSIGVASLGLDGMTAADLIRSADAAMFAAKAAGRNCVHFASQLSATGR